MDVDCILASRHDLGSHNVGYILNMKHFLLKREFSKLESLSAMLVLGGLFSENATFLGIAIFLNFVVMGIATHYQVNQEQNEK